MLYRGYKVELAPTRKQISLLKMHAGTARFAYNWGLGQRQDTYKQNGTVLDAIQLHKLLNAKKQDGTFGWMYKTSKCAPQEALRDLDRSFNNYFAYLKKSRQGISAPKVGYPQFKKKGKSKDSFRLTGTIKFYLDGNHKCKQTRRNKNHVHSTHCKQVFSTPRVHLPVLKQVKLKEIPRFLKYDHEYQIQSATISRSGDRWFVSFTVEEAIEVKDLQSIGPKQKIVGLDVGLSKLITQSNGVIHENPRVLKTRLRKLRKLSKSVSRKALDSKNRKKAIEKLGRLHLSIKQVRTDNLHTISNQLVRNFESIVIEDLNIKRMIKNKKLSKAITDVGWGNLYRQLQYKCEWYGSQLIIAPRFFASSKICSGCESYKADLELKDRDYQCSNCGLKLDRDYNAALNLEKYGSLYRYSTSVATSWVETLNACGEDVRRSDPSGERRNPDEAGRQHQSEYS